MCDTILDKDQTCQNSFDASQNQSNLYKGCERAQKFLQLLNHLTKASQEDDYEEQISAVVAMISAVCSV